MLRTIACVLLGFTAFAAPAVAQNVDAVMERANKINQFMALLEHSDPSVRVAAFEEGVTAADPLFKKRAIEAGLASKDAEVRAMAIVAHLKTGPMVIIEVPEGVRLSSDQTKMSERLALPTTFAVQNPRELEPDKFVGYVNGYTVTCRTTGGVLKCLGNGGPGHDLEILPSVGGVFTGKLNAVPVIYTYK
jgi:hypothetical protein